MVKGNFALVTNPQLLVAVQPAALGSVKALYRYTQTYISCICGALSLYLSVVDLTIGGGIKNQFGP